MLVYKYASPHILMCSKGLYSFSVKLRPCLCLYSQQTTSRLTGTDYQHLAAFPPCSTSVLSLAAFKARFLLEEFLAPGRKSFLTSFEQLSLLCFLKSIQRFTKLFHVARTSCFMHSLKNILGIGRQIIV